MNINKTIFIWIRIFQQNDKKDDINTVTEKKLQIAVFFFANI